MVDVITCRNRHFFAKQMATMFEDRKRVFVDLFKWNLRIVGNRFEIDQFDDAEAVYIVTTNLDWHHTGSLRLLRTDRPHILGSLFPHLCTFGVPSGSDIREITRLCVCPRLSSKDRLSIRNQLISTLVDYALAIGIRTLTGVVSQRFLSQILAMGWRCEPLGPAWSVDRSSISAFRIEVDAETPRLLAATGIYIRPTLAE